MDFPQQNIPESEKNKEWYKKCLLALYRGTRDNERFNNERLKAYENYDFYNGIFNSKQFKHVTAINGLTQPARLVNFPLIQPKLDLLAGELVSSDLTFTANVTNRNAIRKKTEEKISVTTEALLKPLREEIEQMLGAKLSPEELQQTIPPSIKELQSTPYRLNIERQIYAGVNYLLKKFDLKHVFKHGFYDLGITGKEFYRNIIEMNIPRSVKIDSRSMIYDIDTDTEFLHKSAYAGSENYYSVQEILDMHRDRIYMQYSKKEADDMIDNIERLAQLNSATEQRGAFDGWNTDFFLETQNGNLKVGVVHIQWKGLKKFKYKRIENKFSPEDPYEKLVPDDYRARKGDVIITKPMSYVYEATMIGGKYLIDWREKPDQVRYEDNYFDTKLDYFGCIRNNFNGKTLSIVDALKNIQILYNIVHYHIELAIARSGGKSMVYDVSQKPSNIPLNDIMYHAKNSGMIFINSAQEGLGSGFNQFSQVDFTLSQSVSQLVNLKMVLEDTADKLTGITASRSGITKSGDLVGVNERNVMQSSLLTAPYFEIHYKVVGDVIQDLADKLRFCVRRSEDDFYVDVYGEEGVAIMKIDREGSYEQIGINIENSAKEVQRKGMMMGLMERYTNSGDIDPLTAMKVINAESSVEIEQIVKVGLEQVRAISNQNEEQANAIAQQTNEINQKQMEIELTKQQAKNETDIAIATMNNETKLKIAGINRELAEDLEVGKRNTQLDLEAFKAANETQDEQMKMAESGNEAME